MGVKHLWSIIQPVCKKESLESMRGKVLCVDLSTWICQAEETLPLKHAVAKPYLRNTIFRVICLKRLGTRLIIVTEGKPPEIKWDAIVARAEARAQAEKEGGSFGANRNQRGRYQNKKTAKPNATGGKDQRPKRIGRSAFQRKINECAQLLSFLGIPVVKSEGEAEACCAFLDKNKVADGCITTDGDTFLYGGKVVYRNLGISSKDPHVYRYSMDDVHNLLGINRKQMVALALLLGCDYCDGIQGVGKKTALKFLEEFQGTDVLERFRIWAKEKTLPETASAIEKQVFSKAMKIDGFPNEEVIKEFLNARDDLESINGQINWEYPDMVNIQRFCMKHMEWPEEYTLSKVLGVATNEHLSRISRGIPLQCPFSADRFVKSRTQHGVPLCEVEWTVQSKGELTGFWRGYPDTFITLESQQEILECLPALADEFEKIKLEKKTKGKRSGKKKEKKDIGEVEEKLAGSSPAVIELDHESICQENTSLNKFERCVDYENDADRNMFNEVNSCSFKTSGIIPHVSLSGNTDSLKAKLETCCAAEDEATTDTVDGLADSLSCIELGSCIPDSNAANDVNDTSDNLPHHKTSTPGIESFQVLPLRERLQRRALIRAANSENQTKQMVLKKEVKATVPPKRISSIPTSSPEWPQSPETKPPSTSKEVEAITISEGSSHKQIEGIERLMIGQQKGSADKKNLVETSPCVRSDTKSILYDNDMLPESLSEIQSDVSITEGINRAFERCCHKEDGEIWQSNLNSSIVSDIEELDLYNGSHDVETERDTESMHKTGLPAAKCSSTAAETSLSSSVQNMEQWFDFDSPLSLVADISYGTSMTSDTPKLPLNSILTPEDDQFHPENHICSFQVGNLTNDSLGCLLCESISLFDSPSQSDIKENSAVFDAETSGDEYVEVLRRRFGIMHQNTPLSSRDVNIDSPQSVEIEGPNNGVPPTLLERLKKRSQRV